MHYVGVVGGGVGGAVLDVLVHVLGVPSVAKDCVAFLVDINAVFLNDGNAVGMPSFNNAIVLYIFDLRDTLLCTARGGSHQEDQQPEQEHSENGATTRAVSLLPYVIALFHVSRFLSSIRLGCVIRHAVIDREKRGSGKFQLEIHYQASSQ